MKNQPKKSMFKYKKEGRFCIGLVKIEILDRKIRGKRCPLFGYTRKLITIDAYKK